MKLHTAPQNEAVMSNVGEIGEFRIRNSAKAFNILSSGLYANKIRAIIRELSCNAVDSHVAAGKSDTPFDIHLPNQLEPHFSIRDYGTGLNLARGACRGSLRRLRAPGTGPGQHRPHPGTRRAPRHRLRRHFLRPRLHTLLALYGIAPGSQTDVLVIKRLHKLLPVAHVLRVVFPRLKRFLVHGVVNFLEEIVHALTDVIP